MTITISAADIALLQAGKPVTLQSAAAPIAPTDPPPVDPPPVGNAPKLLVVCTQNGERNPAWVEDYSYEATAQYDVAGAGNGNPKGVRVTLTGAWGGYQPSNAPGKSTDFSHCSRLTVDVNAPAGSPFTMQFLKAGDLPIMAPGFAFTKSKDGWETFSCPKAQVMTDNGVDVSSAIYKGAIQLHVPQGGQSFDIDNWGGV